MTRCLQFLPPVIAALSLSGCGKDSGSNSNSGDSDGKPSVAAVNYPLAYFAERIGGEHIDVAFPAPADVDPAFWKPDKEAIATFQSADLILRNGADYAKWISTTSLPESIIVDTSRPFAESFIVTHGSGTHSHGEGGEHSHDGVAFTTWLDMGQAIQQAGEIRQALVRLMPEQRATFEENFAMLKSELEALDAELALAALGLSDAPLVASHPVHQYAARRYGLKIRSLFWEPEIVPDDEAMADLQNLLAKHPAKVLLWEASPDSASVEKLKAIGIESVVFDPAGNRPEADHDFLSVMRSNLEALKTAVDSTP